MCVGTGGFGKHFSEGGDVDSCRKSTPPPPIMNYDILDLFSLMSWHLDHGRETSTHYHNIELLFGHILLQKTLILVYPSLLQISPKKHLSSPKLNTEQLQSIITINLHRENTPRYIPHLTAVHFWTPHRSTPNHPKLHSFEI